MRIIRLIRGEGVTLDAVVMLVTFEETGFDFVVIIRAVETVIIAGRVIEGREWILLHLLHGLGREFAAQDIEIIFVGGEGILIVIGETIEADILLLASIGVIIESVGQRCLARDASPSSLGDEVGCAIDRDTILITLHTIFEDILADLTEVEIEIATLAVGVILIEEGIQEPELDILHIRCFEVGVIKFTHHAAPSLLRI